VSKNIVKQRISAFCIGAFILWLIFAGLLPDSERTFSFYGLGLAPLLIWFLIKPRRLIGFIVALLGLSGLQD